MRDEDRRDDMLRVRIVARQGGLGGSFRSGRQAPPFLGAVLPCGGVRRAQYANQTAPEGQTACLAGPRAWPGTPASGPRASRDKIEPPCAPPDGGTVRGPALAAARVPRVARRPGASGGAAPARTGH